jgi:methionyl-tRNA formyltransferase
MLALHNQQRAPVLIYFFTSRSNAGSQAFLQSSAAFPGFDWRLIQVENESDRMAFDELRHTPDILISFLNPFVIPNSLLKNAGGRAFNVHPALPEYPGRDPQHFAFYDGATLTGATLHRMDPSVDSGEIIDIIQTRADRERGVMHFIEESERLSLELLSKNLPAIIDDTIIPLESREWFTGAKTTRKRFLEMCRIDPYMDRIEIEKRIESFFNPNHRSIYIDLHGYRFVYQPDERSG